MAEMTIGLLGQSNSGKSTLFNQLTGSRQHVGNWPGKTVEPIFGRWERICHYRLAGSYGLSANSEEEFITRKYITSGKASVVRLIADASQLERSLFMLADYVGRWWGFMSTLFFGSNAVWVVLALFLAAFLHMLITAKVFGRKLITDENRTGLIMELPPYHKPRLRFVWNCLWDVFGRALKIILVVAVLFWALSYTADGDITGS